MKRKWQVVAMLAGALPALGAGAGAPPWDIAPTDPTYPGEICPVGNGVIGASDALPYLQIAVGLASGFSCDGVPVEIPGADVAPPFDIDNGTNPPTYTAGGDGSLGIGDALLVLQDAILLINLVPRPSDLRFAGTVAVVPAPVLASDINAPPASFPGPEDRDEGNGVYDVRPMQVIARVGTDGGTPLSSLCAFDVDPGANPGALPLGCIDVPPLADGEDRLLFLDLSAPESLGPHTVWAALDPDDLITETIENNNVAPLGFTVVEAPQALPDLTFDFLSPLAIFPFTPFPTDNLFVTLNLENNGTLGVTTDFAVDFFLDPAFLPEVGDCGVARLVTDDFAAGEARSVGVQVDLEEFGPPPPFGDPPAPGPHVLAAVVDTGVGVCPPPAGADIEELTETNNSTLAPLSFCVRSPNPIPLARPDLVADSIDIDVNGGAFTVSAGFSNAGEDVLPTGDPAEFELSVTTGFGPQTISEATGCFVKGAATSFGFGSSFALPLEGGFSQVELSLDPDDNLDEANENNNDLCRRVFPDGSHQPCP